jgi:type VI secretion system protein ImpH
MAMAATSGKPRDRVIERLLAAPEAFEVFAAVQAVEEEAARAAAVTEQRPPEVGSQDQGAGVRDPVRLRAALTLGFPGGSLTGAIRRVQGSGGRAENTDEAAVVELSLASFGLIGPAGVLPRHYTSLVQERVRQHRDRALRNFLDLFNHRAASLLVRAWGKYRTATQRGRLAIRGRAASWDESRSPRDSLSAVLASLLGLGTRSLSNRMQLADERLLYYAGILARRVPAAMPLENLISDCWGVPARIDQFVGRWLALDPIDQTRLGAGGCNQQLGINALAGSRVWSVESAFCIRIGPLALEEFHQWLPGGSRLRELADLVRFHVGPALEATVRPVLAAAEVPPTQLVGVSSASNKRPAGSQLGWTTWLISHPPNVDRADAAFEVLP